MTELRVDNLSVRKEGELIVQDASFTLAPGELVIMLGPNGAGKSLTLKHAIGLDTPQAGTARLGDKVMQSLDPMARARAISYLPQTAKLAWPNWVEDLVALGRFAYGARMGKPGARDRAAIHAAMAACDITHLRTRKANTLSGGELARVHCARSFAAQTPLLLADEPVAALDPRHQFRIMDLFRRFVAEGGGALIVLHDIALAAKYADRLIWMKAGRIVADGSVEETLSAARLAEVYGVQAEVSGRDVRLVGVV